MENTTFANNLFHLLDITFDKMETTETGKLAVHTNSGCPDSPYDVMCQLCGVYAASQHIYGRQLFQIMGKWSHDKYDKLFDRYIWGGAQMDAMLHHIMFCNNMTYNPEATVLSDFEATCNADLTYQSVRITEWYLKNFPMGQTDDKFYPYRRSLAELQLATGVLFCNSMPFLGATPIKKKKYRRFDMLDSMYEVSENLWDRMTKYDTTGYWDNFTDFVYHMGGVHANLDYTQYKRKDIISHRVHA